MTPDRRILVSTALYFATYICIGALGGTVGPTLSPFAAQVGVGLSTIGIILTTRSLGYLAGALGSTRWMDRIRVHRGLAVLALLAGAALSALPWAHSLGLLVILVVPLGLATAGLDVGVSTMLLRAHQDRSAPYISALHFCYGVGGLAAPFLVAAFAVGQETSAYLVLAAGFAALALAYVSLPEPPRLVEATGPKTTSNREETGRGFLAATSVILAYVGAEIGFASWLFVFVELQLGAAVATAVTGAFWAAFSLARLGAVFIARRFAPQRILAAALSAGFTFALLLVLSSGTPVLVWIGAVGVGVSVGPVYPNVITAYSHRYELTGRRFGAIAVASCTGSMVFPWLIGQLLDVVGTIIVPAMTAVLLVAAAGAAWLFLRREGKPTRHALSGKRD